MRFTRRMELLLCPETDISSRHSRILSCSQQGQYAVKLSAKGSNIQRVAAPHPRGGGR